MVKSYRAGSLQEALQIRSSEQVTPYAGGTDLMVRNKPDTSYLFINKVPELKNIWTDDQFLHIGACVTFTQALEDTNIPALMKEAVLLIAAPAIRNVGTFGGNLGNGSAKADSVLIEYAADAKIKLMSNKGERIVPVENFYRGKKLLDLKDDELITEILLPVQGLDRYYYKKVGGRNALAISRVAFAGVFAVTDDKIANISAAFGAVSGTILRFKDIEQQLTGLTLAQARTKRKDILSMYSGRMVLTQGRVSAEYRKNVCMNLLNDYYTVVGI